MQLGSAFPAVYDEHQRRESAVVLNDLGVRRIRFNVTWAEMEKKPNVWDFSPLRDRLAWARAHGFQVHLTIMAKIPQWRSSIPLDSHGKGVPESLLDWRDFVHHLALELQNTTVRVVEFENEAAGAERFPGTDSDLLEMHQAVHDGITAFLPLMPISTFGITVGTMAAIAYLMKYTNDILRSDMSVDTRYDREDILRVTRMLKYASYDRVSLHLYWNPSRWHHYIAALRELLNRLQPRHPIPIDITEWGGPSSSYLREHYSEEFYEPDRAFLNGWQLLEMRHQLLTLQSVADDLLHPIESALHFAPMEKPDIFPAGSTSGLMYKNEEGEVIRKPSFELFREAICEQTN